MEELVKIYTRKKRRSAAVGMLRRSIWLILAIWTVHPVSSFEENYPRERHIGDPPEFEAPIGNHTYHLGKDAVLTCTVKNIGNHRLGWLRAEDQTILALHTRVVTQNMRIGLTHDNLHTWNLHIRQLKESDRGCYMCQLNTLTMMKQYGCIDVYIPPDIAYADTSTDMAVQEHENASLVCTAIGRPAPRITWKREDGEPIIMKKPGQKEAYKVDVYNGSVLQYWRLDRRQMGAHLCIASNDVPPAVSKRITLNVNFPPTIKVPNQLLGAPLNTDVKLQCYVEAFPNTINYWVKNGGEMLLDGPKYAIKEERFSYKVSMWMVIKKFSNADGGTYNCVSTNSLGKAEGTLRVYEIKLYPNLPRGSIDELGNMVEDLKDTVLNHGEHAPKDMRQGSSASKMMVMASIHTSIIITLASTCLLR